MSGGVGARMPLLYAPVHPFCLTRICANPSSWQIQLVLTGEHHQIHQKSRGEGPACACQSFLLSISLCSGRQSWLLS